MSPGPDDVDLDERHVASGAGHQAGPPLRVVVAGTEDGRGANFRHAVDLVKAAVEGREGTAQAGWSDR